MSKPIVAIVGRPNVGKSRFFNYVVGKRISIVEDTPGVTRDRIYADTSWQDRTFTLIDTGGIEQETDDVILSRNEGTGTNCYRCSKCDFIYYRCKRRNYSSR